MGTATADGPRPPGRRAPGDRRSGHERPLYDAFLAHDEAASLFDVDEIHLSADGKSFAAARIEPVLRAVCEALAPSESAFQCTDA